MSASGRPDAAPRRRQKRLTKAMLEAMSAACSQMEAGDPEGIEGVTPEERDQISANLPLALDWIGDELSRRRGKAKRRREEMKR